MEDNRQQFILDRVKNVLAQHQFTPDHIEIDEAPTYDIIRVFSTDSMKARAIPMLSTEIASAIGKDKIRSYSIEGGLVIEVPKDRDDRSQPLFHYAMQTPGWSNGMELPIFLGYGERYKAITLDLVKAPHILVAGATLQGQSVLLRSLIDSIISTAKPWDVKFLLGDPKMIEFSDYDALDSSYFWDKGIIKYEPVYTYLNKLEDEMYRRYNIFRDCGCSNIAEYKKDHSDMPYIVVVINEYADYMSPYGHEKEFMEALIHLAEKGGSFGIHCIILTQRPDYHNIPGEIIANFPTRLAFRCTSEKDSMLILDEQGAEQLLGYGDLLLKIGTTLTRVQGLYEDEKGTDEVIRRANARISNHYPIGSIDFEDKSSDAHQCGFTALSKAQSDEDFEKAARLAVNEKNVYPAVFQRAFGWGFNKTGRIMYALGAAGILGSTKEDGTHDVLVNSITDLEDILKNR